MKTFAILSFILLVSGTLGASPNYTELESLDESQKGALEKIKLQVSSIVPHDYMKEDIYLVKWLKASGYDASKAEDMLKENLKWREENKVDNWTDPGFFEDFQKKGEYQMFNDGVDREGRPVVETFFGDWDIRAAAVQGKLQHLTHYALSNIEKATIRIREAQAEGKNVTQFVLIVNMDGYNVINQGCPACLPLYSGYFSLFEKYYPNSVYRSVLINTPETFEIVLKALQPLTTPETRAATKVFGANKNEWKPFLDELIDPVEISDWFDPSGKERKPE